MTTFPRLNVGGTSPNVLLNEYATAVVGIETAIKAVRDTTVHGRDHYSIGKFLAAQNEHRERLVKLEQIHKELNDIYYNLYEQRNWFDASARSLPPVSDKPFVVGDVVDIYDLRDETKIESRRTINRVDDGIVYTDAGFGCSEDCVRRST